MSDEVWGWASVSDPELWQGSFASREEAIADASEDRDLFYVMRGRRPLLSEFVSADDVIERANEADDLSFYDDPPFEATRAAIAELDTLLRNWSEKHGRARCWIAEGKPELVEVGDTKDGGT